MVITDLVPLFVRGLRGTPVRLGVALLIKSLAGVLIRLVLGLVAPRQLVTLAPRPLDWGLKTVRVPPFIRIMLEVFNVPSWGMPIPAPLLILTCRWAT